MSINFHVKEYHDRSVVEFSLDGPITPESLSNLKCPEINSRKGVVLSGRGPVWLYAYLVHEYHHAKWVATYDPRLGAVVVQSHAPGIKPGEVLEDKQEELEEEMEMTGPSL